MSIAKYSITLILLALSNLSFSQKDLKTLEKMLNKKPQQEETITWLCDSAFSRMANDPLTCHALADLALKKAEEWQIPSGKARANLVLGISFWVRDMHNLAINHYLEALTFYDQEDNTRGIAIVNLNLGNIYDDLEQRDRAKDYILRSLRAIRTLGDSTNLGRALSNLGVIYSNLNRYDSAMISFKEALKVRMLLGDTIGMANVYNNITDNLIQKPSADLDREYHQQALENITAARNLLSPGMDDKLLSTVYANLGKVSTLQRRFSLAHNYLDSALFLAEKVDSPAKKELVYAYKKELEISRGNFQEALEYLEMQTEMDKQQRNAKVAKQVEELNIQYQTAKKEKQLVILEKEKAEEHYQLIIALFGIGGLLILSIGAVVVQRAKANKNKTIAQLKEQELQNEIDRKNRELTSYTLNFIQKNEILEELLDSLQAVKSSTENQTIVKKVRNTVKQNLRADQDWQNFRVLFEQVHPGFFSDLKEQCPELGNAELRLCALTMMNLNLKESSQILGISPDSVKTARYRLKKKLSLGPDESLAVFLMNLHKTQPLEVER